MILKEERLFMNRKSIVLALMVFMLLSVTSLAFASEAVAEGGASDVAAAAIAIGAGLAIAIAAAGGGVGQGRAIASAMEGIARNPGAAGKIMTPMIIGLAMIESLVIYALVIALMLVGKI